MFWNGCEKSAYVMLYIADRRILNIISVVGVARLKDEVNEMFFSADCIIES